MCVTTGRQDEDGDDVVAMVGNDVVVAVVVVVMVMIVVYILRLVRIAVSLFSV